MCQGGSTTKFPLKQLQHHCVSWKPRGSPITRSIARLDYKRVSFKHLPSSFFQAIHVVIARLRHMEPLRWLFGSKTMSNPWLLHGYDGGSFSEKLTELKSLVKPAIHGYSKKKLTISNFNQNTKICLTPIEQSCKNHQERPDLERHGTGGGVHGKRNDDPHGRGGSFKIPTSRNSCSCPVGAIDSQAHDTWHIHTLLGKLCCDLTVLPNLGNHS